MLRVTSCGCGGTGRPGPCLPTPRPVLRPTVLACPSGSCLTLLEGGYRALHTYTQGRCTALLSTWEQGMVVFLELVWVSLSPEPARDHPAHSMPPSWQFLSSQDDQGPLIWSLGERERPRPWALSPAGGAGASGNQEGSPEQAALRGALKGGRSCSAAPRGQAVPPPPLGSREKDLMCITYCLRASVSSVQWGNTSWWLATKRQGSDTSFSGPGHRGLCKAALCSLVWVPGVPTLGPRAGTSRI